MNHSKEQAKMIKKAKRIIMKLVVKDEEISKSLTNFMRSKEAKALSSMDYGIELTKRGERMDRHTQRIVAIFDRLSACGIDIEELQEQWHLEDSSYTFRYTHIPAKNTKNDSTT